MRTMVLPCIYKSFSRPSPQSRAASSISATGPSLLLRGELGKPNRQRGLRLRAVVDPFPDQRDLVSRKGIPAQRHPVPEAGCGLGELLDDVAGAAVPRKDPLARRDLAAGHVYQVR